MTLDDAPIQRFLGTKAVVVLATVQADGAPLAMPMWFVPGTPNMLNRLGTSTLKPSPASRYASTL